SLIVFLFSFFFFQAEDGIRDDLVTGVQTCALPISSPSLAWLGIRRHDREGEAEPGRGSRLLPGRGAGRRHLCRRWLICPYLDENKSDSLISKEAVALPSFHSEATLSRVDAYIFVSLFKH